MHSWVWRILHYSVSIKFCSSSFVLELSNEQSTSKNVNKHTHANIIKKEFYFHKNFCAIENLFSALLLFIVLNTFWKIDSLTFLKSLLLVFRS